MLSLRVVVLQIACTVLVGCQLQPEPNWLMYEQRSASGGPDIYRVQFDGSAAASVSPGGARDELPAWSQAQREIAFESDRDGTWEIYRADENGANATRLTQARSPSEQNRAPAWSPSGDRIAFASNRIGGDFELYWMNNTGSSVSAITQNNCSDTEPAWSPDGSKIAYASNCNGDFDIWLVDAPSGTNPQTLLRRPGFDDVDPVWSPDGSWIAFESQSTTSGSGNAEIWKVRADGSGLTQLAAESGKAYRDPAWAPGGGVIAYSRIKSGAPTYEIWIMEADDGGRKTRISTSSLDEQAPAIGTR